MKVTFKIISIVFLFTIISVLTVNAQETPEKEKKQKHQCTEAFENGKHSFKHGEKGHKYDASCKTTEVSKTELKDHVYTDACHNSGKCVKVHGEKDTSVMQVAKKM